MLNTRLSEPMQKLCFEIGRTLLMCSLVETHLHAALNSIDVSVWLDYKPNKIMGGAIKELAKQFGSEEQFILDLDRFRKTETSLYMRFGASQHPV